MPKPPLDRSNGDDRRQRRKQGGAVGAAASRMQATAKQTLGAATRPWREAPERARTLAEKRRRGDSIALTKRQLIAVRRLLGDGLALSVIASQCHLSQRERLWPTGRRKKPPGPALRGEKLSFRKRVCKAGLGITPYTLPPTVHYRDHRGVLISVFLECTGV